MRGGSPAPGVRRSPPQLRVLMAKHALDHGQRDALTEQQPRGGVAQVVEPDGAHTRLRPQPHPTLWAAALGPVPGLLEMATAFAAAHVRPALCDACATQGPAEEPLERHIPPVHATMLGREDEG
jgi:hypothetical protein